ncbi:MAG: alpha/beta hydrolase [Pseudomonadota bacterium]
MENQKPLMLDGPNGRLACLQQKGAGPGFVWFGGFRSDMTGTKATFIDEWAAKRGRAFLRFDYSGHGQSDGAFEDGTIGAWAGDALAAVKALTDGPQIFIGSSMGAWTASLVAKALPERVAGAVFIAPAPDFTEELMWPSLTDAEREAILRDGRVEQPSDYDEGPTVLTRALFDDGREQRVFTDPLPIDGPVVILHGMGDDVVPTAHAIRFAKHLDAPEVEVLLTKSGDHRLSSPADLARLASVLERY